MPTDNRSPEKNIWLLTECCNRMIHWTQRFCPCCGWECRVKELTRELTEERAALRNANVQIEALTAIANGQQGYKDRIERLTRERDEAITAGRTYLELLNIRSNDRDRLRAALGRALDIANSLGETANIGLYDRELVELQRMISGEPGSAVETSGKPRESDWHCTHCGRDNDPSETHCAQCEWSRKHTIAGVLHERGCMGSPCRCGAESAAKAGEKS